MHHAVGHDSCCRDVRICCECQESFQCGGHIVITYMYMLVIDGVLLVKGDAPRRCSSNTKNGELRQQSPYPMHWGVRSTDVVGLFTSYFADWPSNRSSLRMSLYLFTDFGFDL